MKTLLAVMMICASSAALASPGKCLLEVKNVPKLIGTCNVEISPDGSFSIGTATNPRDLTFFGMVNVESDGVGEGYWNGVRGAGHAHDALGTLKRKGACWENDTARICAWK